MVLYGLIIILLLVLVLPFSIKKIEENLEVFLFVMGIMAAIISGKMATELLIEAVKEPVMIALAVLLAGALFFVLKDRFSDAMSRVLEKIPVTTVVFFTVLILGLLSSIITAIVASIILIEIIYLLPMERKDKIVVCILACFSIGLGASLTPIGEPLATIAISKLDADFLYLFHLLGKYIIPSILLFSILAAVYTARLLKKQSVAVDMAVTADAYEEENILNEEIEEDTWKGIIVRAIKVYLFVMALVFLGEGFEPLINAYLLGLSPNILYWVNMISAVLDNATLCAAEVSPAMNDLTVKAILMGLLISGGMLIPGNIPNIISASKLRISSKEWAKIGVPLGLIIMTIFYIIL